MIAEFKIKNFLSIRDELCLNFRPTSDIEMLNQFSVEVKEGVRLLKLAIIYGSNASGKTNALEALSFLRELITDGANDKSSIIDYPRFMLDDVSRNKRTQLSITFYLERVKYILSIELDNTRIYKERLDYYPGPQPANIYARSYNEETDSTEIQFGAKLDLSRSDKKTILGNCINNCTVFTAFAKSNVEQSVFNLVYDFFLYSIPSTLSPSVSMSGYITKCLEEDKDNKMKGFIVDVLAKSEFNICDLQIESEDIALTPEMEKFLEVAPISDTERQELISKGKIITKDLVFKHATESGTYFLPEQAQSGGTLRFIGMIVMLYQLLLHNRTICIDEIESKLHYELLLFFIRQYVKTDTGSSQLIVTTHDINLLNEKDLRRDTVWFIDKDANGGSSARRLSDMKLHKSLSPYNAYKQGKLGAKPNLEDINLEDVFLKLTTYMKS